MPSHQESYAKDLEGTALGVPVYYPIELGDHTGRVGDIAYFDQTGRYRWIRNAFHVEVTPS